MRDLLLAAQRVKFSSLEGIREAYSLAFSDEIKKARPGKIDEVLADHGLEATAFVRNLLVHKGGVVDTRFLEESEGVPIVPRLALGDKLLLDSDLVKSLSWDFPDES
jgi:hypothetical protein